MAENTDEQIQYIVYARIIGGFQIFGLILLDHGWPDLLENQELGS